MNDLQSIKMRPTTYQDLRQKFLPIKTYQNIRRSHNIRGTREIPRLGWKTSDGTIALNLRLLEQNRLRLANWKFVISNRQNQTGNFSINP